MGGSDSSATSFLATVGSKAVLVVVPVEPLGAAISTIYVVSHVAVLAEARTAAHFTVWSRVELLGITRACLNALFTIVFIGSTSFFAAASTTTLQRLYLLL